MTRRPGLGVTGYLRGGLGNQLFIAATALAQSRRLGAPLILDTSFLAARGRHAGDITSLGLDAQFVADAPSWLQVEPHSRLGAAIRPLAARSGVFMERNFTFDPRIDRIGQGTTLVGYFQSWRYFSGCADQIRRFALRRSPSPWFVEESSRLRDMGPWVGVHVRRGDYLDPAVSRAHGAVHPAYIARSMQLLREMGHSGPVVLFSDDPEGAIGAHPALTGAHVVRPPAESHPFESLVLMSRADALVTANSSFSWWGGYMGDRPERPVICPRPWFGSIGADSRDLLPPHWLTLERRHLA